MEAILSKLSESHNFDLSTYQIERFGGGHIHQTWLANGETQSFIIQQFNKNIFTSPGLIAHNHQLLIDHLDLEAFDFILPLPIPNIKGETLCQVGEEYFRVLPFVEGQCSEDIERPKKAFLAARAFASLIQAGSQLEVSLFQEVIPGFHDLELRFKQFTEAKKNSKLKIEGELEAICEFYVSQSSLVKEYQMWISILPKRITHNDTKINNLIYSRDFSKVKAIIDLDTMMPGYIFNDFGDLVRTVACTLNENAIDYNNIKINVDKYQALYEGFIEGGKDTFTKEEIASLHFGGEMMIYIMGLRFLTDYLNGNIYYQIKYEKQNYDRTKNQMYLLKALQKLGYKKNLSDC